MNAAADMRFFVWCCFMYNISPEVSFFTTFQISNVFYITIFLSDRIATKSVTEKTVKNLNVKFWFNEKFRLWAFAFRNCAYFVMKPSGCDTVRLGV